MTDDFTLVDFVMLAVRPGEVAQALGQIAAHSEGGLTGAPGRPGFLSRIRAMRAPWRTGGAAGPGLFVHPPGHLPPSPLARGLPDDLGFGAGSTPFRVSAPLGSSELTLVEFREGDSEMSPIAAALSARLRGVDVFYFRLSGLRHPGSETAFHIYRDGHAIRRVASISPVGTTPEAEWRVIDTGMPHTVEADSLPGARARAWDIMTPERQGAILTAMGVDPDTLFTPDHDRNVVDLSTEPGGAGLHEAWKLFAARPAPPEPEPELFPEPPEPEMAAPYAAPAGADSEQDESNWDSEVTGLLVKAVAYALPEEEQIPWLTHLTTQLEDGAIDEALKEARALIEMGNRPAEERAADAARLDALFGIGVAGDGRRAQPPS